MNVSIKRAAAGLLALIVLIAACPVVVADEVPAVYYSVTEQTVASGAQFNISVTLKSAATNDITVEITDGNSVYEIPVKAGSTEGSITLTAQEYKDRNHKISYKINRKSEYKRSEPYTHTVTVLAEPYLDFSEVLYTVVAGKKLSVEMICRNNENLSGELNAALLTADGTQLTTVKFDSSSGWAEYELQIPTDWEFPYTLTLKDTAGVYDSGEIGVAVIDESKQGIRQTDVKGKIAMGFDCGYENQFTQYILDTLDEYGAKATFFVTGMFVEKYPDMLKEIYARGHEIGNHTVNHYKLTDLSVYEVYREINNVSDGVEAVVGVRPTLMRPPYGAAGKTVAAVSRSIGCEVVYWTVDSYDWHTKYTAQKIIERSTDGVGEGYIMLFHNSAPHTEETLRTILDDYVSKGLEMVTISDMLYDGCYVVDQEGMLTIDPDYTSVKGSDVFAEYTTTVSIAGVLDDPEETVQLEVRPVFTDEEVIRSLDDVQTVTGNHSAANVTVNCAQPLEAPVSSGDVVGTMQFSYNGEVWFTAEAQAVASVPRYTAPPADAGASDDRGDGNTFIYVIDVAAAAAILISVYMIFIRKNRSQEAE